MRDYFEDEESVVVEPYEVKPTMKERFFDVINFCYFTLYFLWYSIFNLFIISTSVIWVFIYIFTGYNIMNYGVKLFKKIGGWEI
jgi:hypothetical protein